MVAEPPQNEGDSHPSEDDVVSSNRQTPLPRRGSRRRNNNRASAAAHNAANPLRQHYVPQRYSPPPPPPPPPSDTISTTTNTTAPTASPSSSSSSPSPCSSSGASSSSASATASSFCDNNNVGGDRTSAPPPAAAVGAIGIGYEEEEQQQQPPPPIQQLEDDCHCSQEPPHPQQQQQQQQNQLQDTSSSSSSTPYPNTPPTPSSSCSREQVPLNESDSSCIRQQQGGHDDDCRSPSPQMTEVPHQHKSSSPPRRLLQKRDGDLPLSPPVPTTRIIVTPDEGEECCSMAVNNGRRKRSSLEDPRSIDTSLKGQGKDVEIPIDMDVGGRDPKGVPVRRNSCGSPGSGHSNSTGKMSFGRGGTIPDLSEFERVWEAAPEVIIKPATLASSETLTPTEALTPTPTHTLDSFAEARSVASAPSAFTDNPQDSSYLPEEEDQHLQDNHSAGDSEWGGSRGDDLVVGAVGGGGHACGCGVQVGGLDESCGRCPSCPAPAEVYVSEQFPSSDPLECVDGSTHTLHVDLSTGEVQLHMHLASAHDPEKGGLPPPPPAPTAAVPCDLIKCLHDPCAHPPPATSQEPDPQANKKAPITFSSGIGEASVYHALVVIFLEFFAWGLLTAPMITVLNDTFPDHTFLMNGLIVGIKGILSFLSAPLIGALSDLWGRKFFLFVTVFFTCLPIPFMKINTWWYFALISMSGVFAVTFSIVFAYVADVTDVSERSSAYGLVSATFAASLVTSPALGAYLGKVHSNDLVVGLATAIAILDVFFILVAVPESLPEKLRLSSSWSAHISWEQADPFSALWKVSKDRNVLLISVSVFLSYLPEAGQYSCFFVYLRLVMDFTAEMVATFIAVVGILSVVAQTCLLSLLMKKLSNKHVIIVGLVFEMLQLMWYGFGSKIWMMWAAGLLAAVSSITYPAISAYVSTHTDVDKQGVVQGIITGMRGLCSGLGPAVFGFIFYLFHVDLNTDHADDGLHKPNGSSIGNGTTPHIISSPNLVPGPPFVFGALLVICALMVAAFIPEGQDRASKNRKQSGSSLDLSYDRGHKKNDSLDAASLPLMDETDVL